MLSGSEDDPSNLEFRALLGRTLGRRVDRILKSSFLIFGSSRCSFRQIGKIFFEASSLIPNNSEAAFIEQRPVSSNPTTKNILNFPFTNTKRPHLKQLKTVSYTHLTLPTILLVKIAVVAVSLKKKT
eukprot:TRINITY_DN26799_c0_g1_i1.p1 TRINITY_DN26799_c0_g1~~TRINITY_DN26799_c0_g1_i1.p1  ORF type:complete len:127 (+),score=11.70 TRINITY_DN26799_c0_g1_i1:845-1225(+)